MYTLVSSLASIIGNINHPSIANWGLNLFWYNFWFTDYSYFYPLHQDNLLRAFFYVYVNYGMFFPTHTLLNTSWYRAKDINNDAELQYNSNCFSLHNTPYDNTDQFGKYNTRLSISCMYISRIWILRFADWFILCFYSLSPNETNLVRNTNISISSYDTNLITINPSTNTVLLNSLNYLLTYHYVKQSAVNNSYIF